ncbi:hypothetical protein HDZ31DRAFT_68988 [Schizophyllum fasciatum]
MASSIDQRIMDANTRGLAALQDPPVGEKPHYSYSELIYHAILSSPRQLLLIEQIEEALQSRFPYFRTAPPEWKSAIRRNLSLNSRFKKVLRPADQPGKGYYWAVDEGCKVPRNILGYEDD